MAQRGQLGTAESRLGKAVLGAGDLTNPTTPATNAQPAAAVAAGVASNATVTPSTTGPSIVVTTGIDLSPYVNVELTGFAQSSVNVYRMDPLGNQVLVRNGDPLPLVAGAGTVQDYETPLDTDQFWQARDTSSGVPIATSATIQLPSGGLAYLGHPGKPSMNMRVSLSGWNPGVRQSMSATYRVINKSLPVVRSLRRSGPAGSMRVRTEGAIELAALQSLLDDGNALLLRSPAAWIGVGSKYISVGDTEEDVPSGVVTDPTRFVTAAWTEVARPAGLAQAGPGFRWSDVVAAYPSWTALIAANPTWAEVIDGVP